MLKTYGGQEIIEESFAIFVEEAKEIIAKCKKAIKKLDYSQATEFAHSLKGSAKTLGIEKLGDAAYFLEQICKQNKINQGDAALKYVEECFDEFLKNYRSILGI